MNHRTSPPVISGVILQTNEGQIIYANESAYQLFGCDQNHTALYNAWEHGLVDQHGKSIPPEQHPFSLAVKHGTEQHCIAQRIDTHPHHQVSLFIQSTVLPQGEVISYISAQHPNQHANQNETQLKQLEGIERISKISLESDNIDQMLNDSLGALLDIFDCDRAALIYPCNPKARTITIPMEQTRPEWPGAVEKNVDLPVDNQTAAALEAVLNSPLPVCYGPGAPNPLPQPVSDLFHIKSQMLSALHPKLDEPWGIVIHHCRAPHTFTQAEAWLFQEISQRIGHALSSLIALRILKESEEQFRTLVQHAPEAIFVLDVESHKITDANTNAAKLFKLSPEQLIGRDYLTLSPDTQPDGCDSGQAAYEHIRQATDGDTPVYEWTYHNSDGDHVICETRLVRLPSSNRPLIRGSITDISERKKNEAHMRQLSMALEQTADAVMITNANGIIEYVNAAFEAVTGYSRQDVAGKTPSILKSDKQDHQAPGYQSQLWQTIQAGKVYNDIIINRRKDGSHYYEEKTITPLKGDDGTITHFISTGRDISDRMQTQEYLHFLAHHDTLTQLPNRALFIDRTQQAIQRAQREQTLIAVIFADLDRFKIINDTLGHEAGDQVLRTAAERFQSVLRSSDTVSRQGGDEFTILLEDIYHTEQVAQICEKLLNALTKPIHIRGQELFLSTSLGISVYPEDGIDPRTLIKHADIAMYRAKESGRNTFHFFSLEMSDKALRRLQLETDLRKALGRNEFELYYQPKIELRDGNLIGFEALLRWQHADAGLMSPLDFIPVLEETGLIVDVGEWVLKTACIQLHHWHQFNPRLELSVNVSNRQFNNHKLEENFKRIIQDSGVDPSMLEFEITESLLMINPDRTESILSSFSEMGIGLSIDDFGTGYSSLSYLRRFPLDKLKIDRSFVRDITTDADDAALISAIISMAKSLRLQVTAEGVETNEQLNFLKRLNCETAQGFLFHKPLTAREAEQLILERVNSV